MVKISAAIDPFVAAAGDGRTPQGAGEWRIVATRRWKLASHEVAGLVIYQDVCSS
jgi:hypothetical protein